MVEYREVDFIPTDWVERAAWWPGLQVHSRPVRVPVNVPCPQRRKTNLVIATTSVDVIEQLLQEALLLEPFQSVDLDELETLLNSLNAPKQRNTVAQSAEH